MPARTRFPGLASTAFQHPLDRQATDRLQTMRGFDTLVSKFIEYGLERIDYVLNVASNVRVGPRQLPKVYAMLQECCAILDVSEPELYVRQGLVNAYTSGHTRPFIVLQTGLLEIMDDNEVLAVLAHEVGHIKCNHVLYKAMARTLGPFVEIAGSLTLGIGSLVGAGVEGALMFWDRRSEFSADRAALLVMQDVSPCISMLMKLAGGSARHAMQLDLDEFLHQARAYGEDMENSVGDRFYRLVASMSKGSHPFAIERAKALNTWADTPEYQRILDGAYEQGQCPHCSQPVDPSHKFCAACGKPVGRRGA